MMKTFGSTSRVTNTGTSDESRPDVFLMKTFHASIHASSRRIILVMAPRYRWDDFVLDLDAYRLERQGAPLPLEPKAFELLRLMLDRPHHLFTKGEIFDIETVPSRGYRWIAPVAVDPAGWPAPAAPVPSGSTSGGSGRSHWIRSRGFRVASAAFGLLVLAVVLLAATRGTESGPGPAVPAAGGSAPGGQTAGFSRITPHGMEASGSFPPAEGHRGRSPAQARSRRGHPMVG